MSKKNKKIVPPNTLLSIIREKIGYLEHCIETTKSSIDLCSRGLRDANERMDAYEEQRLELKEFMEDLNRMMEEFNE